VSARSIAELVSTTTGPALPLPGEPRRATQDAVFAVRQAVAGALGEATFLVDCVRAELQRVEASDPTAGLAPFAISDDGRLQLAFGYWAPRSGTGPHEHIDWTVTAVVHNQLDVTTYHYRALAEEGRLVPKNHFSAQRGKAGQIHEPCIHAPENPTGSWSLTLHVLGPNEDGTLGQRRPDLTRFETPAPAATEGERRWHRARVQDEQQAVLVEALAAFGGAAATQTLEDLASRASHPTRYAARRALMAHEGAIASAPSVELDTVLVERLPMPLRVEEREGRAVLRLGDAENALVLMRTPRRAAAALHFVSESRTLRARDLPGPLSDADRLALGRALHSIGLYHPEAS